MNFRNSLVSQLPRSLLPWWERLERSPLGYRLARGAFWSLVGAAISRGLGLAASILVARMLGKHVFGELGIIQNTVGMFGVFAGFGMGLTANKHVAEFRSVAPERAGRIMALSSLVAWVSGCLMAAGLALLAPWLAGHTLAAPGLGPVLRVGSLMLLFSAVNGAQIGALAGFEAFKRIAAVNLYTGLATFPLMVLGAWQFGLVGAVWSLVVSQAINCLLAFFAIRNEAARARVPLGFSQCTREWAVLWTFSLPAVISTAMSGPVNWVCSAIIVNQPNGYGEMGVFNAANQWRNAILFVPGMLAVVALPLLSHLNAASDLRKYRRMLNANLLLCSGSALVAAVPVACIASRIMAVYGSAFEGGAPVLIVLAAAAVITATLNVIGQAIASQGKMWVGFLLNAIWAAVMIGVAVGLRSHGALGLALASLVAYGVHFITVSVYVYRRLHAPL